MSFSAPTALVAQEAADTAAERKKQEGRITAGMAYGTQPDTAQTAHNWSSSRTEAVETISGRSILPLET